MKFSICGSKEAKLILNTTTKQEENLNLLFLLNFKIVYNMLLTCLKASL